MFLPLTVWVEFLGLPVEACHNMITTIHVDRNKVVSNFNTGEREPVLVVEKDGLILFEANEIDITGPSKVIYSPDDPHPVSDRYNSNTNIRAWIETESEVIKIK